MNGDEIGENTKERMADRPPRPDPDLDDETVAVDDTPGQPAPPLDDV